jgi:catechol 2,3-dioxygenase-like lactoylglutathione lyase family enzyme
VAIQEVVAHPVRRPLAQFTHLGFQVRDMDAMIAFYTRVLGLVLTDRGPYYRGGEIAFLSRKEDEHHQVVFASGRGPEVPTIINQISFLVEDLETLQAFYQALKAEGVTGFDPINHGNAWSVYFPDPEGNRIELYCVTPWHVQQPFAEKFDLDAPIEEIRAKTLALIQADPSHCPRPEWISTMRTKLDA